MKECVHTDWPSCVHRAAQKQALTRVIVDFIVFGLCSSKFLLISVENCVGLTGGLRLPNFARVKSNPCLPRAFVGWRFCSAFSVREVESKPSLKCIHNQYIFIYCRTLDVLFVRAKNRTLLFLSLFLSFFLSFAATKDAQWVSESATKNISVFITPSNTTRVSTPDRAQCETCQL